MNIDIFSSGKSSEVEWASFKEIGDSYQGTYIGKYKAINKYNQSQTIYELLDAAGKIIKVGVLDTKKIFHNVMDHVFLGQIVGFKYTENKPSKNGTGNDTKIIAIWQDPKIVNQEWIDRQKELSQINKAELIGATSMEETEGDEDPTGDGWGAFGTPTKADEQPVEAPTVNELDAKLKLISELAQSKIGVSGDANVIKDKVMEVTGLAFLPVNYDKIISQLQLM
jgi:hypothetical protein